MNEEGGVVTSERSSLLFFEELYASYTQIWQEVIKLTDENTTMIPTDVKFLDYSIANIELREMLSEFRHSS